MKRTCLIAVALFGLWLSASPAVRADDQLPAQLPPDMAVPRDQLQTYLDDGWKQEGPDVIVKDLNGDGTITPPDEVKVLVPTQQ